MNASNLVKVDAVPDELPAIAAMLEVHEADIWARCIEAAADLPGNPLGAVLGHHGLLALPALTAVDAGAFNRVVGLGVDAPATGEIVDQAVGFYRSAGQRHFQIELAPIARPDDVAVWLRAAGLRPAEEQVTKVWGRLEHLDVDADTDDADWDIRELSKEDAERVAALNVRAWGAWHSRVSLGPWFGATVGRRGFAHYGGFVEGRLLCTGALVVDGPLAWIGFDATHPRHRSRQLRRALTARRIIDARSTGCTLIHAEARTDRLSGRARMLGTLYVRTLYAPSLEER